MNILCTTSSWDAEFPNGLNIIKNPYKRKLTEEDAIYLFKKYQPVALAAGTEPLTGYVLKSSPSIKVISRCGVGLDSIDLEIAYKLGIKVFNTPEAPTIGVAEHTLALALALMKKVTFLDHSLKCGIWQKCSSTLLEGKVAGIIGCGKIGSYVGNLFKAFGCNIICYDPIIKTENRYHHVNSIDELLEQADIISLHLPLNSETKYIIGERQFKLMKPEAFIINTSRGGLIDENALLIALQEETIAGAALDVFEEEPYNGQLIKFEEKIVLTPHVASNAKELRIKMEKETVENIIKGLQQIGLIQV